MEALTFNINGGFLEGIVRGYRNSMLTAGNYQALTQCETLDDLRMQLSATDYGNFLANEPSPLSTSAIAHRATQKLVGEFDYLRTNATAPLSKFLDYLTYSYMIDNVILLITGTLHGRDTHELLDRCHPLGWFDTLPALCVATNVEELYRTVLVETPLSAYFRDCLSASELDDLNIEIIRNKLYKAYLEDFYHFTQSLGGTTAESMGELLAFEADRRTINITINSFGTSLSKTERARLFPAIGKLFPAGNNALAKADELDQVKAIVESVPEYRRLFEDNGSNLSAGGVNADMLEDKMFELEVESTSPAHPSEPPLDDDAVRVRHLLLVAQAQGAGNPVHLLDRGVHRAARARPHQRLCPPRIACRPDDSACKKSLPPPRPWGRSAASASTPRRASRAPAARTRGRSRCASAWPTSRPMQMRRSWTMRRAPHSPRPTADAARYVSLLTQLLREGGNDEHARINTKKKRRLDKYIEAKLRKEEKARLLQKLAQSSEDIRDRTELVSAATLGTGRASKEAQRVQKMLASQQPSGKRSALQVDEDDGDEDLDDDDDDDEARELEREHVAEQAPPAPDDERQARIVEAVRRFDQPAPPASAGQAVGSALAVGPDGKPMAPVVRKRKRKSAQNRSNMSIQERIRSGPPPPPESDSSDSDEADDEEANVYDVDKAIQESRERLAAERAWKRPEHEDAMDSDESVATDELVSEAEDTDEEQEAVLLHAMRMRGMLPGGDGPGPSQSRPKGTSAQAEEDGEGEDDDEDDEDGDEGEEDEDGDEDEEEDEDGDEDEDEDDDDDDDEVGDEDEEEDDDDDDEDEDPSEATGEPRSKRWGLGESARTKAFKQWAMEALQLARPDFDTEGKTLQPVGGRVDRVRDLGPQDGKVRGPLGRDMVSPAAKSTFAKRFFEEEAHFRQTHAPVRHVPVERDAALQEARMALPVVAEEDLIVRTINENPVTVLCGETGSGKTTQVPQFLYEAAYAAAGSGT